MTEAKILTKRLENNPSEVIFALPNGRVERVYSSKINEKKIARIAEKAWGLSSYERTVLITLIKDI